MPSEKGISSNASDADLDCDMIWFMKSMSRPVLMS